MYCVIINDIIRIQSSDCKQSNLFSKGFSPVKYLVFSVLLPVFTPRQLTKELIIVNIAHAMQWLLPKCSDVTV